jgi:hypothetical protein
MATTPDVAGAVSITVTGCHGHRTLCVREDWDSQSGVSVQSIHLWKDLVRVFTAGDTKGTIGCSALAEERATWSGAKEAPSTRPPWQNAR